jgi:hypothetical protein
MDITFPYVLVALLHSDKTTVIQDVICYTKVIAKTFSISCALQCIKRVLLFPGFEFSLRNWLAHLASTVSKGHELFKWIHSVTSTQVWSPNHLTWQMYSHDSGLPVLQSLGPVCVRRVDPVSVSRNNQYFCP